MGTFHLYIVYGYIGFFGLAAVLTLLRRHPNLKSENGTVQQKSGVYILINLTFLTATWLPQGWHLLTVLLSVIGALASWELSQALRVTVPLNWILPITCASLVLCSDWFQPTTFFQFWWIAVLTLFAISSLIIPSQNLGQHILSIMGSLIYFPFCFAAYLWIWHTDSAGFHAIFFYLIVTANDTFAQITGQLFGRHPLAPQTSPTKTVEGALGGLFVATLAGIGLARTVGWSNMHGALIGAITAFAGLIGDLSESRLKRALGLKDFSKMLRANGGVLDRFDSLIFAAPIFYLSLSF